MKAQVFLALIVAASSFNHMLLAAQKDVSLPDVSLEDVLDGIRQRRSGSRSAHVIYEVHETHSKEALAVYAIELAEREKALSLNGKGPDSASIAGLSESQEVRSPDGSNATPSDPNGRSPDGPIEKRSRKAPKIGLPRDTALKIELFQRGDVLAFSIFDIKSDSSDALRQKGAYDGHILKVFTAGDSTGLIKPMTIADAISFPTISQLAGVNGLDLESYLQDQAAHVSQPESSVDRVSGDVLISLTLRKPLPLQSDGATRITLDRVETIVVNASKEFWLQRFEAEVQFTRGDEAPRITRVEEKVVDDFWESNGHSYPKHVTFVKYSFSGPPSAPGQERAQREAANVSEPTYKQEAMVSFVRVNEEVADERLAVDFPPGTRYRDYLNDGHFLVDFDGTIRNMADVLGTPVLPVDEVSEEEATKILEETRRSALSRSHSGYSWLIGLTVVTGCVISGFLLARRLGARR